VWDYTKPSKRSAFEKTHQKFSERRVKMYIEKLQLSGECLKENISVTFQKGVFCPETAALEDIDVAKILTFFFYGSDVLKNSGYENIVGTLYFCENTFHYRINASKERSALYKITVLAEEQIELEDGVTFGDALFGVSADVFEATVSFGVFDNQRIAKALSDITLAAADPVGVYDLMNNVRSAAKEVGGDGEVSLFRTPNMSAPDDLGDTIVLGKEENAPSDPLEATRVVPGGAPVPADEGELFEETIRIAPAPDLEIEAMEKRIRGARREIDSTTTEREAVSKKIEIGKMSDLAERIADYKEKKAAYAKALEKKRLYEDTYRAGTIELPDNEYVNELNFAVEEIKSCEIEMKSIHDEKESIDPDHNNNKISNLYIKVEDEGGIEAIRDRIKDLESCKRIYKFSSVLFVIAGMILVLAGAAVALLPVYKSMYIANTAISVAHAGLFVLTMGLVCLLPSITSISGMQSTHEHILEMFVDYGCENAKTTDEFLEILELAVNESEEKKERLEKLRLVEKKVAKCQSRVNEGQRIIREHLTIWDRPFDSRLSYCENAQGALERAREFLSEYEDFKNEAERARAACDEAGYYIMGFEDQIFESNFDPSLYKMTAEEIAVCEDVCESLKDKLNALYDELDELKEKRDALVFEQKEQKAQKAKVQPDPWLCELIDKLEVVANSEDSNAWEMTLARAQMITAKHNGELMEQVKAAVVLMSAFETFYDKVMPPQFIRLRGEKEAFLKEMELIGNDFVSNQIVIY